MSKEVIIDIKDGNITGLFKGETVILKGDYLHEDSNYIERPTIIIKKDNDEDEEYPIKFGGYNLKIFVGNFSSDKKDDILLYGETGRADGYAIVILYRYENGKLEEVFNGESFFEKYKFTSQYLDGYKAEFICPLYERKYILDISNLNKDYLNQIYSKDSKIITNENPSVSYVSKVDVLNNLESNLLKLEIYQRIIGVNNSNTLGEIKTIVSFQEDEFKLIEQYAITYGEIISALHRTSSKKDEILSKLPDDAIFIDFNKFGGSNGVLSVDIDGDGSLEMLCGYKSNKNQYLAAFREYDGVIKYLDTIGGEGYDISDLVITKLKPKGGNNILVGWRIGAIWSALDILEFKENKFNKLLNGDKINYSKVEIVEFDNRRSGTSDIALWSHETGEAYKVQLYTFRGDNLEKTSKNDREYFNKVEEYYINLINKTRETPQYLYYLIDAQYRCGKRKEAISNINKALKHPKPYPSLEELKRFKKKISD